MSPQRPSRAVWVTWPGFLLNPSEKSPEAQPLVRVMEAHGSNMSGVQQDRAITADSLHLNGTAALGLHDQEMNSAQSGVLDSLYQFHCFDVTGLSS